MISVYSTMYSWFLSLFQKNSSLESYKAAGCIFTSTTHVLAGVQRKKGYISGFGGSKQDGETYVRTAMRELLEELLEVSVPQPLLSAIELRVKPFRIHLRGSYVLLQYTFEQLEEIISLVEPFCRILPLYTVFPRTIMDLIQNRNKTQGEISTLCLLPLEPMQISPDFIGDLQVI